MGPRPSLRMDCGSGEGVAEKLASRPPPLQMEPFPLRSFSARVRRGQPLCGRPPGWSPSLCRAARAGGSRAPPPAILMWRCGRCWRWRRRCSCMSRWRRACCQPAPRSTGTQPTSRARGPSPAAWCGRGASATQPQGRCSSHPSTHGPDRPLGALGKRRTNERAPSNVPCRLGYVRNLLVQWCSANAGRWAAKSGLGAWAANAAWPKRCCQKDDRPS